MSSLREAIAQAIQRGTHGVASEAIPVHTEGVAPCDTCQATAGAVLDVFLHHESVIAGCRERWEQQARQRIEALREAALAVEPKTAGHALELGGYVQGFSEALEALGGSDDDIHQV